MATHLLGKGPAASLGEGFLPQGAPPGSALRACLPRLAASVPGGASAGAGGGEDAGSSGEDAGSGGGLCSPCSCSRAFRAMKRWCCRLFRLCFLRSASLACGPGSKGQRRGAGSGASLDTIPACSPLRAREAGEAIFQRGSSLERGHRAEGLGEDGRLPGSLPPAVAPAPGLQLDCLRPLDRARTDFTNNCPQTVNATRKPSPQPQQSMTIPMGGRC